MNATGRQQGVRKGRTMGIKPTRCPIYQNMFSKQPLPKERSHHRRHSGQFGLLGKPCQGPTETNGWTKKKSAVAVGGASWHEAATWGTVQHSTTQSTTAPFKRQLSRSSD